MKLLARKPDFTIPEQGRSEVVTLTIGGIKQTILIQTENSKNPILLVLHGGPSMPVPGVSNRGTDYALITCTKELIKHFTLVFWDQRGTGKSYSKEISKETMHLKQFIRDANELIDSLLSRFQQAKLHLLAHSWGTVMAIPLIHQYPEKFYSYTGFSQIVNWAENDKLCYQWVMDKAKETNRKKALKELTMVGEPPYLEGLKQWSILRKWLFQYKSMIYDAGDKGSTTYFQPIQIMLRSPDYSLKDIYHSLLSGFKLSYTNRMIADINHFDFRTEFPSINVPVLFIHGEHDKHVLPELVQQYFDLLDAPQKQIFWAKKSSHAFHLDDAKEIEQLLIKKLQEGMRSLSC